jgi:hypothetical protein
MSDQAIVFVADAKFLPHTKSLAVNCRRQGEFTGDFLWIVPDDMFAPNVYDLTSRGAAVLPVADRGFLMKFNLFHPYLKRWRQVLFLDADCMVQRPLSLVFDQLDAVPPLPNADGRTPILADREEMPAFMAWQTWDPDHEAHGMRVEVQPDTSKKAIVTPGTIYGRLSERYPHVLTERMWNTSMVAWHPGDIPDDTVDQLRALQAEFGECNRPEKGGTDQQIIDLLLHQRIRLMPNKLICYWGLDEKASRVPSASRGWVGGEIPAVIHMARWYANWIVKASNADAYFNDRLGVVNHEHYLKCLEDFETVFPRVS